MPPSKPSSIISLGFTLAISTTNLPSHHDIFQSLSSHYITKGGCLSLSLTLFRQSLLVTEAPQSIHVINLSPLFFIAFKFFLNCLFSPQVSLLFKRTILIWYLSAIFLIFIVNDFLHKIFFIFWNVAYIKHMWMNKTERKSLC